MAANPRASKLGASGVGSGSMRYALTLPLGPLLIINIYACSMLQQIYSSGSNMLQGVKSLVIRTKV